MKETILFVLLVLVTAGKFYALGLKHGERRARDKWIPTSDDTPRH